jgi:hypothetical protein
MPRLQFALLARAAEASQEGTFSAVGAGGQFIFTPILPTNSALSVVGSFLFEASENTGREHIFALEVFDPDNEKILAASGTCEVKFDPRAPTVATYQFIVNLVPIQFSKEGKYEFIFTVDGTRFDDERQRVPLRVHKVPAKAGEPKK